MGDHAEGEISVHIERRFNGPPDSAHGGVACGVFAGAVDSRQATVRLTAPPPLDTDFDVVDADGWRVITGPDGPVARVRRWDVPVGLDPLPLVDASHIERGLSLIHISEPTRPTRASRMPSSA